MLGNSNSWNETTKAFIFSLNNTEGLAPFVSKVKKEYTGKAIRRNLYDGPQFGNDIIIADDADSSSNKSSPGQVLLCPSFSEEEW